MKSDCKISIQGMSLLTVKITLIYAEHKTYSDGGRSLWAAKWLLMQRKSSFVFQGGKIFGNRLLSGGRKAVKL